MRFRSALVERLASMENVVGLNPTSSFPLGKKFRRSCFALPCLNDRSFMYVCISLLSLCLSQSNFQGQVVSSVAVGMWTAKTTLLSGYIIHTSNRALGGKLCICTYIGKYM